MRRYLVTGGCGFIGSHLADALAAAGESVRVLDNLSTGTAGLLPAGAELVVGDLADPCTAREATRDIDGCFHLAAVASVPRCNEAWLHSHRSNLSATIGLFEAATGAFGRRFPVVYASSAAVYGERSGLPLREDLPARPRSPYGADKAACELHARAGAATRGLASVGLRFFNVYGPRQRPDSAYSGVIPVFADRIGRGLPLVVHGDGGQTRDFVFVADVVRALLGAMRHLDGGTVGGRTPADILNVCTGEATTVAGLAGRLMALSGLAVPVTRGPPRDGDIRHAVGSPDRLAQVVGVRPDTPLDEGLRRTLDWPAGAGAGAPAPAPASTARPPGPARPGPAGSGLRARPATAAAAAAVARAVLAAVSLGATLAACAGPPPPPAPRAGPASAPRPKPTRAPLAIPRTQTIVADHSGKCLDVEGGLADDGVAMALWACNARPHQLWTVRDDAGGGGSRIVAAHSGKCLSIAGAGTGDEGYAVQQPCGAGEPLAGQGWDLQRLVGDRYRLISTVDGGCLDAEAGGMADGTRVLRHVCVPGARHQEWVLTPASPAATPAAPPPPLY